MKIDLDEMERVLKFTACDGYPCGRCELDKLIAYCRELEQQLDRYARALTDQIKTTSLSAPYSGAYQEAAWERVNRILRGEEK